MTPGAAASLKITLYKTLLFAMTKITHWGLGGQLSFATFCRTLKASDLRRASHWYIVPGSGQFEYGKY